MYIFPNTTVRIMKNVPLDNAYSDTIYFDSLAAQQAHFTSYPHMLFQNQSYQRVHKGKLRLQVLADKIYDYNYMMFQNTAYGNKWFYAFITSVEYVNDSTTEVSYELDVMQTWLFNAILEPSYVEREHTADDTVGANIAPEPVDIGPVICTQMTDGGLFGSYVAVVAHAQEGG